MKREEMKNIAPKLTALKLKPTGFILADGAIDNFENAVLAELLGTKLKSTIGNTNPFKITENYFENFEDSIVDSLKNKNHNSIKNTLKVPDNYFDNVEQKVLSKLQQPTAQKEVKVISLRSRIIKISTTIVVAASLALFFIFNPMQQSNELSFNSLKISEIEAWINGDYLDLDANQIASVYKDEKLHANLINATINEVELENFLNHENIDQLLYEY